MKCNALHFDSNAARIRHVVQGPQSPNFQENCRTGGTPMNGNLRTGAMLLGIGVALSCAFGPVAWGAASGAGEAGGAPAADDKSNALEEIIVTARRREES